MARARVAKPSADVIARAELALKGQLVGDEALAALRALVAMRAAARPADPTTPDEGDIDAFVADALAQVGIGEWSSWSIRDYDAARYGPLFGVSDDGMNAATIAGAFLESPKSKVLRARGELSLATIGACIDAERMSAAGELLVGPAEYGRVYAAAAGRVPMSTNVGTVVLPRFYRPAPYVTYLANLKSDPAVGLLGAARAALAPYTAQPGAIPRKATVFVSFRVKDQVATSRKVEVLKRLAAAIGSGAIGDPAYHGVGLLQRTKDRRARAAKYAIDVAVMAGITEVRLEGPSRFESQDQLLLPGLLAFYTVPVANDVLQLALAAKVNIEPKNAVDPETASRTIWAGLTAARSMGAQLGKFGLFPLTLDQQVTAMQYVAEMASGWTATPAFYADRPTVDKDSIFEERETVTALDRWLAGAARAQLSIVLIDAPDRTPRPAGTARRGYQDDRGRRLIKRGPAPDPIGIFEYSDIDRIRARAADLGLRIMWAGGLDGQQVFDLARRGEFAIFTTTATARRVPAGGGGDPSLAARLQPTHNGVLGVKMVVEAGFLAGRADATGDVAIAKTIEAAAAPIIEALDAGTLAATSGGPVVEHLQSLGTTLEQRWEKILAGRADP